MYVIEAEVKPLGLMHLVQTCSVECVGDDLPSHAGKFTFLLPADSPSIYHINFKFRSLGSINNHCNGELIDEVKTFVITHDAPKSLSDYWDGHSLPAVDLPLARKQLVGESSAVLRVSPKCIAM